MTRCTAKTARNGARCTKPALEGLDVCGFHRAFTGLNTGLDPQIRPEIEGIRLARFGRALPNRMHETLVETATDPELLSMAAEIQLIDTRIDDLIKRAEAGESGALWKELKEAYRDFTNARREKKNDEMVLKLADLGHLIERGHADYAAWNEVVLLVEVRRKLVESEQKRMIQLKSVLTYDEAVTLATRFIQAVQVHVLDPEVRGRIGVDIREALGAYRLALPADS